MQDTLNHLSALLPADLNLTSAVKFLLFFTGAVLTLGFLAKLFLGKHSDLNRSICGSIGIFFIYVITTIVHSFDPADLSRFLAPLPYVIFSNDKLYLFIFEGTKFPVICSQVLSMILLAFLFHFIDDFMPEGKKLHWLLYRLLSIMMAMALHYVTTWLINNYLPGPLLVYAPTALLVILISLLLLGFLKVILGLVLTVVNPLIGAIYAFFFSSKLGCQLRRAVITTLLLSVLVVILHEIGYSVISVSVSALSAYIPLILILLGLWYVLGHIL